MTTEEAVESARANSMGNILFQLDPNTRKIARRLEKNTDSNNEEVIRVIQ